MAHVYFTTRLCAVVADSPVEVEDATVGEALENALRSNPQARGYVLDELGALRQHVCIFLEGERLTHASALVTPLHPNGEIYVMQALSGG